MDSASIIARVAEANDRRDLRQWIDDLREVDSRLLFEALFPIAIREQGVDNGPVAFSAYVLHALNPPCLMNPQTATEMLGKEWDISIEEVPWYLANQFGREVIDECVGKALEKESDRTIRQRLKTVKMWIHVDPGDAVPKW